MSSENQQRRLNLVGWKQCGAFQQAKTALSGLQVIFPQKYAVNITEYETRDEYMNWLPTFRDSIGAPNHKTSPIAWFEDGNKYLGGRDDTLAWIRRLLTTSEETVSGPAPNVDSWNPDHGFDYDLVVIGGGSGGLACSKEAKLLGVDKVAVLDFVKPSPNGSKWGLGGTCVNVGCIPKKLMHYGALLGEYAHESTRYGWNLPIETAQHNWETLKNNVQDHIKGLNFGYRVELREKGVTYLNKLGRFVGPNQLETMDAKGNKTVITAARFVIATGGRPVPLKIPGGEHAISSDDIFSLSKTPGKTCIVGAGYIALECAGFLAGLKQGEVTVLVRSRPLRTFDQDTVGYVMTHMKDHIGVSVVEGVLPHSIEKLPSGKLLVTFGNPQDASSNISEEFDTVLVATGRTPDVQQLGLDSLGIQVHPQSGKLVVQNEQTNIPHIYAIGDIIEGGLELTPVAILAGKLLSKRLFGNGTETMRYDLIPSVVFTPLEMGVVGITEEDARQQYGEQNVDAYLSQFVPLEWSLQENAANCFAKVVVHRDNSSGTAAERVVGIHLACPGAGEIIQGFALAMKKGLTMAELHSAVGIHPTIGEELTLLKTTRSSSASFTKAGC
jgi:thioredoxin reductase (NADPH)